MGLLKTLVLLNVMGTAVVVLPGSLLEIQSLRPFRRPTESESLFNRILRQSAYSLSSAALLISEIEFLACGL